MKVSIITVVLNGENFIADAIESVNDQDYRDIEHLVIDGLSSDSTPKIIEAHWNPSMTVIREQDDGLYDAMNKGISLARGEIIGILNSDDWYEKGVFKKVIRAFSDNANLGLVYGAMRRRNPDGSEESIYRSKENISDVLSAPFNHPSCFVRADVYEEIGVFDKTFPTAADYDWMLRFKRSTWRYIYCNEIFTNFRLTGVTGSDLNFPRKQIQRLLEKNSYGYGAVKLAIYYRYVAKAAKKISKVLPGMVYARIKKMLIPYLKC